MRKPCSVTLTCVFVYLLSELPADLPASASCLPACLPCADKELREVWELLEQRYKMSSKQ